MIQLVQFALIFLLAFVTLRIVYLLGKETAKDELNHAYSEYSRMANRLAASERGKRRDQR